MKEMEIQLIHVLIYHGNRKENNMEKRMAILLSIISIFTLTACGGETNEENETIENATSINNDVSAEDTNSLKQEAQTKFIQEAFHTLLDYDNATYDERTQKATEYFTGDTLLTLTGTEHVDTEITFTSTSDNYQVYQGVGNRSDYFILILDTSFQVEENPSTDLTNIYEFQLLEDEGQYRIGDLQTTPKQQRTMVTE